MREAILTNPIIIVEYDLSWPTTFQQLRDRLAATLGPLAVAIEHVGSTAVPGLAAKPIIDLDVVIADRVDLPAVLQRLGSSARGGLLFWAAWNCTTSRWWW